MKISNRDWTQLSAYLDGELSQRELKKFDDRINENPEFQAALEDLQNVKTVLAHTPSLAPPRNFILKPGQVHSTSKQLPTRRYRLAAAVMTFLFLGVVVVDVGSGMLTGGFSASMPPRAEEVMLESAADAMEEPALLVEAETFDEEAAIPGEVEKAAESPPQAEAVMEGEAEGEEITQTQSDPEEVDRGGDSEVGISESDPDEVTNTIPQEEEPVIADDQLAFEQDLESAVDPPRISWLRILEIAFGVGAVGFAIAAWIIRRRSKT
jgi:hypothetical protein